MSGDFKVVRIKQVFHFNSVRINEVPLYILLAKECSTSVLLCYVCKALLLSQS